MPAKKMTPAQSVHIRQLEAIHAEKVLAKAHLRALIEAEHRDKMRDLDLRESRKMNEAKDSGVPKTVIARTVGTSNWETLEGMYSLTASEFKASRVLSEFTLDQQSWDAENRHGDFILHFATIDGIDYTEDVPCKVNHDEDVWWAYPTGATSPLERAVLAWRGKEADQWFVQLGERVGAAFEAGVR